MIRPLTNFKWQKIVKDRLSEGYGVEDIAVMEGFDVEHVRLEVKILREAGQLRKILHKNRSEWISELRKKWGAS